MTIISPLPEPDNGRLRIIGYDRQALETSPDETSLAVVRLVLSRDLTRWENHLMQSPHRTIVEATIQGRIMTVGAYPDQLKIHLPKLDQQLYDLEREGGNLSQQADRTRRATEDVLEELNVEPL